MASPLVGRPPTCLACLRRITSCHTGNASVALTQVRGKKTEGRLKDQGVVVRLLKDVPQFGPEGSIFRTDRGRMRNHFFPNRKAEYMTRARFAELGLTRDDIGERDYLFGLNRHDDAGPGDAVEAIAGAEYRTLGAFGAAPAPEAPAVEIEHLAPNRALELMQTMIPETIVFERRLIHPPTAAGARPSSSQPEAASLEQQQQQQQQQQPEQQQQRPLSPLEQRRALLREQSRTDAEREAERLAAERRAEEQEQERLQREREAEERRKIHGSVSLRDIANQIRETMVLDPEASRIHVQPEEIKFLGLDEGVDKVEKIGVFDIEIRTHVGKARVEPVSRKVEVVPL